MDIQHTLGIARAAAAHLSRYMDRRERFLDALDWSMLTEAQVRQSTMFDELLEDDLAAADRYIDWLIERQARGAAPRARMMRFAPHPRPWHPQWITLAA
jgi:hypothetical protein